MRFDSPRAFPRRLLVDGEGRARFILPLFFIFVNSFISRLCLLRVLVHYATACNARRYGAEAVRARALRGLAVPVWKVARLFRRLAFAGHFFSCLYIALA